jgi:hypothetical protein
VPCRYHLLRRGKELTPSGVNATDINTTGTDATGTHATSTNATGSVSNFLPGSSGRWQLEEDGSGLEGAGRMMAEVDNLNQLYSMYNLLQVGLEGRGGQAGARVTGVCGGGHSPCDQQSDERSSGEVPCALVLRPADFCKIGYYGGVSPK